MKSYFYAAESNGLRKIPTIEEAQAEAEQLAAKHPGRAFEILRCVGIAQTSKASTFWMDGEQPPEKPRYRMLEKGETFKAGDQFLHLGVWTLVPNHSFGLKFDLETYGCPHRRPL